MLSHDVKNLILTFENNLIFTAYSFYSSAAKDTKHIFADATMTLGHK